MFNGNWSSPIRYRFNSRGKLAGTVGHCVLLLLLCFNCIFIGEYGAGVRGGKKEGRKSGLDYRHSDSRNLIPIGSRVLSGQGT